MLFTFDLYCSTSLAFSKEALEYFYSKLFFPRNVIAMYVAHLFTYGLCVCSLYLGREEEVVPLEWFNPTKSHYSPFWAWGWLLRAHVVVNNSEYTFWCSLGQLCDLCQPVKVSFSYYVLKLGMQTQRMRDGEGLQAPTHCFPLLPGSWELRLDLLVQPSPTASQSAC